MSINRSQEISVLAVAAGGRVMLGKPVGRGFDVILISDEFLG
jgi:hypothetical protein